MGNGFRLEIVSPKGLKDIVKWAIENKQPVFIEGQAGIGKSQIVKQVAKELRLPVIDMRAILFDIGDLVMKIPKDSELIEVVTNALPKEGSGILFLDEFKQAPTEVRRMFYQLILDRKLGSSYTLPKGWTIIAASNLDEEIEQDELEGPLFDRFVLRVRLETSYEDWKKWAHRNSINSAVIGFLELFSDKLYVRDEEGLALVTPRRWEWVSKAVDSGASDNVIRAILPPGISDMFVEFKKKIDLFKNVSEYLEGKREPPVELDKQYALASAIINSVDSEEMLKKVLTSNIDLNTEVKVYMHLGAISRSIAKSKAKNKLQYISKLKPEVREAVMNTLKKYSWLLD